uniref:Proteasome alpha-type subunits domain-containing protein n=1 Tax=Chromera velia CCMP2878 TaxID=1169474 RepID=A0A0G4FK92_9ALVE|mmetsp:Transcript_50266/g.98981  ORF Transcript_50266/g.98981 Transcript_50266/m.98981 type:complete len:250 (-) Transcript_50266:578-1327(-)|eukprot:Cvel_17435.t1-p1 / transcript=Cvel_17435.t1 / gene=Cvel_17435 / organism=Chromera_velia_CCMP2878 / gene_product=Proteasome subunit alpha type-1, putative / transcript_product=Proteasome subunit alpha type-1, putative / location=Cvel_scaffold1390:17290-22681(+) / protein_length=249 / sequence_SO=supercontig / SO=protein_coding / is_pseudo=false
MYRNQYDTDCITWSPQGRIFQIEYAMEAVKQGTCIVGLRTKTHAFICSFNRSTSQLAMPQQKLFKIDDHMGIAISGLNADARVLSTFMRNECMRHKYSHQAPLSAGRLVALIGNKSQINTQRASKRPFGVGLLVAGVDNLGPHIYETCPSGNFFEYTAMALGGRSQSARTYLEKHFQTFDDVTVEEATSHILKALAASCTADTELSVKNVSLGIVGKDCPFYMMDEASLQTALDAIKGDSGGAAPMDTS